MMTNARRQHPYLGMWVAVSMAVLVTCVMTWLHFHHEQSLREATQSLEALRSARADLAKGFLFVSHFFENKTIL